MSNHTTKRFNIDTSDVVNLVINFVLMVVLERDTKEGYSRSEQNMAILTFQGLFLIELIGVPVVLNHFTIPRMNSPVLQVAMCILVATRAMTTLLGTNIDGLTVISFVACLCLQ